MITCAYDKILRLNANSLQDRIKIRKDKNWNNGLGLARCHLTRRNIRSSTQLQHKESGSSHENNMKFYLIANRI